MNATGQRLEDRPATRALFWLLALIALVMALMPHPPHIPGDPSDKIQHATAFAALSVVGSLAYSRIKTLRLLVALSLFGALIEVAQAIPAFHRDSDPLDWLADTVACAVVLLLVAWWRRDRR